MASKIRTFGDETYNYYRSHGLTDAEALGAAGVTASRAAQGIVIEKVINKFRAKRAKREVNQGVLDLGQQNLPSWSTD
jgi:hypothetical protein